MTSLSLAMVPACGVSCMKSVEDAWRNTLKPNISMSYDSWWSSGSLDRKLTTDFFFFYWLIVCPLTVLGKGSCSQSNGSPISAIFGQTWPISSQYYWPCRPVCFPMHTSVQPAPQSATQERFCDAVNVLSFLRFLGMRMPPEKMRFWRPQCTLGLVSRLQLGIINAKEWRNLTVSLAFQKSYFFAPLIFIVSDFLIPETNLS